MSRPGVSVEAEARSQGTLGGRLGKMSLKRQVATLAMWPFLEQILAFLVATVDLIFTGRLAEGELRVAMMDAMGLGGYTAWLLMIFQGAVGTGVMALVSRATGARDGDLVRRGLAQGLLLGLATGLVVSVTIFFLLPVIISCLRLEWGKRAAGEKLSRDSGLECSGFGSDVLGDQCFAGSGGYADALLCDGGGQYRECLLQLALRFWAGRIWAYGGCGAGLWVRCWGGLLVRCWW